MSLLSAITLSKSFGPNDVFKDVSLSIQHRARIGLVGPNGVGKTTFMRILLGEEDPSAGEVQRARGLNVGYLPQNATLESERTVWQECLAVFSDLIAMQRRLSQMEHALGAEQDESALEALLDSYGKMQHEFEWRGGYTYETRIRQTLNGLGFVPADYERPLRQLSGGQRTRAFLARLLLINPDVLLLDEPTNHLDIAATEWLEGYLKDWDGALLFISHDRYFLDQVATDIFEMTPATHLYHGNYTAYLRQRQERWERLQQIYESEKERLEKDLDYVKRNIAGQRTQQAKGRLRRLSREVEAIENLGFEGVYRKNWAEISGETDISDHMMGVEEVEKRIRALRLPSNRPPELKIHLKTAGRSGDLVLRTHDLKVGYQDEGRPLFSAPDLTLLRGECAGVIGPNGAGKSTFLKTLLGQLSPYAGAVTFGASLQIGYFAQAHEGLKPKNTLMQEIEQVAPHLRPGEIRDYLAKFLFSGDDVFKRVEMLSGGERGRLALAVLALSNANLLLLDEPTNHLDLPSQEILQSVLADYKGTIMLVSHDRYLIDALATQIWEVDPDRSALTIFNGSYTEYKAAQEAAKQQEAALQSGLASVQSAAHNGGKNAQPLPPAQSYQEQRAAARAAANKERHRKKRLADLEAEIEQIEDQVSQISRKLEDPPADPGVVLKLGQEYERLQEILEQRMEEWAALSEQESVAHVPQSRR